MKKVLILLIVVTLEIFGQDFKTTGTAGFTFLGIPVSARSASLGESSVAFADMNAASIFSNPAGLGFTSYIHSFSASYSPWFADIIHSGAAYSYKSSIGVFAFGFMYVDYGTMDKTVKLGGQRVYEKIGSFGAKATSFGLAYSNRLTDKFSFGINLKYVSENIDIYSASNFLMDGGFLYYTGLGSLRLGMVVQNFGTDSRFKNSEFKMPTVFRLGAAMEVLETSLIKTTLSAEAIHPTDAVERINLGAEITLSEFFILRGGYKINYDEENYNLGFGIRGIKIIPAELSYSISNYGVLGLISRFTLEIGL